MEWRKLSKGIDREVDAAMLWVVNHLNERWHNARSQLSKRVADRRVLLPGLKYLAVGTVRE